MKFFAPVLLLCIMCTSCAEREAYKNASSGLACIQIVDRNGISETISTKERLQNYQNANFTSPQPYSQVLRIYGKNEQGKTLSKLTRYHENGQIHQYLDIVEGRAFGYFREWHPNGVMHIETRVIGGPAECSIQAQSEWVFDGMAKVWNEKGKLLSQMNYEKGSLHGPSIYYDPEEGFMIKFVPYVRDKIEGKVMEYTKDQKILSETSYKNGIKQGKSVGYWKENSPSYVEEYQNGLLEEGEYFSSESVLLCKVHNGEGKKAFFKDGFVGKMAEHKKGVIAGKVEIFDPSKNLLSTYQIHNGKKQGEEILYYLKEETGGNELLPKLCLYWENDLLSGQIKSFYPSGQIESQKQMSSNKKNGTFCAWYQDGKMMFIEEYEDDLLQSGSYYKKNQPDAISSVIGGRGIATLFDKDGSFVKRINYEKGEVVSK
jgi:antitoxin component YwqK of YwqJK toxin-antitoxin module